MTTCDVLVIGAGIAGCSVAHDLAACLPITPRRSDIFVLDRTPAPGAFLPWSSASTSTRRARASSPGWRSRFDPGPGVGVDWDVLPTLVERLVHRLPVLEAARVTHAWAGFIETTPDDNPVVGWTHLENLYTVAGFSGHGMCLAPGLAPQVARELRGEEAALALDVYRLERFERGGIEREAVWGGAGIAAGTAASGRGGEA